MTCWVRLILIRAPHTTRINSSYKPEKYIRSATTAWTWKNHGRVRLICSHLRMAGVLLAKSEAHGGGVLEVVLTAALRQWYGFDVYYGSGNSGTYLRRFFILCTLKCFGYALKCGISQSVFQKTGHVLYMVVNISPRNNRCTGDTLCIYRKWNTVLTKPIALSRCFQN